jgi:hypothetical protein
MSEPLPERGSSRDEESRPYMPSLPAYPSEAIVAERMAASVCDECERPRAGTARYTILHIIFLVVFTVWRFDTVHKCPYCMRVYLLQRLPLSMLLATFLAPIIFVWWSVLFLRTFK